MWEFKQFGYKYIVSIKNHTEIVEALMDFCVKNNIRAGSITGIGAANKVTLRFFDTETKQYVDRTFEEQMEITNVTGNISTMDGKIYLHIHITASGSDYKAFAGHLQSAVINGAGEFIIEEYDIETERTFNPEIGINLYDFNK